MYTIVTGAAGFSSGVTRNCALACTETECLGLNSGVTRRGALAFTEICREI